MKISFSPSVLLALITLIFVACDERVEVDGQIVNEEGGVVQGGDLDIANSDALITPPSEKPVAFDARGFPVELSATFDAQPEAVLIVLPVDESGKADCSVLTDWTVDSATTLPDFCRVSEDSGQCEGASFPGSGYLAPGAGTIVAKDCFKRYVENQDGTVEIWECCGTVKTQYKCTHKLTCGPDTEGNPNCWKPGQQPQN